MTRVIKTTFDGGVRDPRSRRTSSCASVRHFITKRNKLVPYRSHETESVSAGTLADFRITDVIRYNYTGSTTGIFALGQKSTSQAWPKIFRKASINDPTTAFEATSNGEDSSGTYIPGSLTGYKGDFYCLKHDGTNVKLVRFVNDSSITDLGSIGALPANGVVPAPFVHPKDNLLYLAASNTASSFNGTTISSRDFSSAHSITSTTYYGNSIALGMVSKEGTSSVVGLWSGSTTSSELIDVLDFGDDVLLVLENIGDVLVGVSGVSVGGASDVGVENNVVIRYFAGGTPQVIQKLESNGSLGSRVYPLKQVKNNVLYFPMSLYLDGTRVHQLWCVYRNESGEFIVQPDRKLNNDTEITTDVINGFSMIGDWVWCNFGTSSSGSLLRTNDSAVFTATSSYETLVNPGMNDADLSAEKSLKWVRVRSGSPTGVSHTVSVYYKVEGGDWVLLGTASSSAKTTIKTYGAESSNKPLKPGREYSFKIETTGNGEIYSLEYDYDAVKAPF